jgi:glutathione S-transferase
MSGSKLRLHRHPLSGHSHRVELLLSLLGVEAERITVDLLKGAHKAPEFLRMNPFGQVPVLEDGVLMLADSNAILVYLAHKFDQARWLPTGSAAQIQRWLSVAAGPLASGPATARLITVFGAPYNATEVIARSHTLLQIINAELAGHAFLVGNSPTLADVACYAYIAHAPEGNVSLVGYPEIRRWLAAIESLPGFVPMQATAAGLLAA